MVPTFNWDAIESDSGDDEDAEDSDAGNPRHVLSPGELLKFDPKFSKRKWKRLKHWERKMLSSIVDKSIAREDNPGDKGDEDKKKSNRAMSMDRNQWFTGVRGLYSMFYNGRLDFNSQDEAYLHLMAVYRTSRYFRYSQILPKLFSTEAVRLYASAYHTVPTLSVCVSVCLCICPVSVHHHFCL